MKIAVDGYELGLEARGVGRVIHNFLIELLELRPEDEFVIYTKEKIKGYGRPAAREIVLPGRGGQLRWLNGPLRRALRRDPADVFIASNYLLPLSAPAGSVLFEHDISVISHPAWYPRKYTLTRRFLTGRSLRRAAAVVVPSEFVKTEILGLFDLAPQKIRVIWHGLEEKFRPAPAEKVAAWRKAKGLEGKRVIGYLGAIFERRHIPVLLKAAARLRRENPAVVLYLVGRDFGVMSDPEVSRLAAEDWVLREPVLPEGELALFYSGLDAFAYLSEYEGFGFPPLEALACGAPAVVLNRSSLREIFTGLAIMVESPEEREVAAALRAALDDGKANTERREAFAKARSRFTWNRAASELSALLDDVRRMERSR